MKHSKIASHQALSPNTIGEAVLVRAFLLLRAAPTSTEATKKAGRIVSAVNSGIEGEGLAGFEVGVLVWVGKDGINQQLSAGKIKKML